jgi:hypothetical protein
VGTSVTISASSGGCVNPRYQFWLLPPGGAWTLVQPYSSNNSFLWNTSGLAAGTYLFSVWARDVGRSTSYDGYATLSYQLTTTPCSAVSVTQSPATTATHGSTVTITASATGCSNPRFEIWILPPGGTWTLLQGYTGSGTYMWNTSGYATGTYTFSIWARDASSAGTSGTAPNTYDAFNSFTYSLT